MADNGEDNVFVCFVSDRSSIVIVWNTSYWWSWWRRWHDNVSTDADVKAKKAYIDVEMARKERRITSGASIIIMNVLSFLRSGWDWGCNLDVLAADVYFIWNIVKLF